MSTPRAVAWSGLAALAVAMGVGRFAFTPVLPMMQADAGLSLGEAGWLATANYVGYLAGALWAAARPARAAAAIRGGLAAIVVTTLAMGLVDGLGAWLALRFAAGAASAWVLVAVSAWALGALAPLGRPLLNGTAYAGVGAGIALAGVLCLAMMRLHPSSDAAWIALGALALVIAAPVWMAVRGEHAQSAGRLEASWRPGSSVLIACYAAFGLGYIIPATYLPAMARDLLDDPALFGWAWPVFGAAAAASTLAVAPLLSRFGNRGLWAGAHFVMAAGVVSPLLVPGLAGILIAAACVGGTFMVATMTGLQEARERGGASLIAAMTAAFATGQILGPLAVMLVALAGGSWRAALIGSAAILAAAAIVLLRKGEGPWFSTRRSRFAKFSA